MNFQVESLFINLSYLDIISFLKAYHLNYFYYKNENAIQNYENNNYNLNESIKLLMNENNIVISNIEIIGNINLNELDIILIDNSTGSYYPFLNLNLKDVKTNIPSKN